MLFEHRAWRISDEICILCDDERQLAYVVKIGDTWFAFDATRSNDDDTGFSYLGSFARKEAALQAIEADFHEPIGCREARKISAPTQGAGDPKVLQFQTLLPLYALEVAAGKFGKQQKIANPEDWIQIPPKHLPVTKYMFLTHIKGCSMEPTIPDGSLCAFSSNISAPFDGRVLLMEEYGEAGGSRYAVKRYRASKNLDPNTQGDQEWLHERITLESINPNYPPWDIASARQVDVIGEFVFTMPSATARA
jgi:SOS-response transcriptional repressor LexA